MDKAAVINAVSFLVDTLRARGIEIQGTILFGSYARGTATPDSDIDVAVISPDFEGKDVFERAEMVSTAEIATVRKYLVPIDLLTLTPLEHAEGRSLSARFVRDGKTLSVDLPLPID